MSMMKSLALAIDSLGAGQSGQSSSSALTSLRSTLRRFGDGLTSTCFRLAEDEADDELAIDIDRLREDMVEDL